MNSFLRAIAAMGGLAISTALAQAPPSPAGDLASQAISQQAPDQWLASKFKGMSVIGADGVKIGDVTDVLFDRSGKVNAIIVGIGGFLGIGQKEVALPLSAFEVMAGQQGRADVLKLAASKEELQQLAEFRPLAPAPATTGAAPPSRPNAPMSPSPANR